jgi:hypothetical protein
MELINYDSYGGLVPYTPQSSNKTYRDSVPNTMSTFSRKKYQKLAPGKSPGIPLCRYSLRFFNSALWASDTKNLFTLFPRRSTEISLMGQNRKHHTADGYSLLSALSTTLHMNGITRACRMTATLAATANVPPHSPFSKGARGLVGVGD